MPVKARSPLDRFNEKHRLAPNGCWEWTGARKPSGYGNFLWRNGTFVSAHRASWLLHRGEIAGDLCVLHKCDNPWCVNPEHLFLGTYEDNMRDMRQKGRARGIPAGGESSPNTRYTDEQVREMKRMRVSGMSLRDVAAYFGSTEGTVSRIARGLSRPAAFARQDQ